VQAKINRKILDRDGAAGLAMAVVMFLPCNDPDAPHRDQGLAVKSCHSVSWA